MKITADIVPVPLDRTRNKKDDNRRFLPARSRKFREDFQWLVRAAFRQEPFDKPLAVTLHFYKPLISTAPKYGDIDNLVKAVLDAGNGVIWLDDRQITELHAYKHKGAGKIEIEVSEC